MAQSQDVTYTDTDSLRIGKWTCRYAGVHGVCFLTDWDLRIIAGCDGDNIRTDEYCIRMSS